MAVAPWSYVFVTLSNSTINGWAGSSAMLVGLLAIRKQAVLDPSEKAIDAPCQSADHNQDENDVFRQAASLAGAEQISPDHARR